MKVTIIGVGPGHERWLSFAAKEAIAQASLMVATPRLCGTLAHLNARMVSSSIGELVSTILSANKEHESVAVLVSGDVGFFSASSSLIKQLSKHPDIRTYCINGLSSLQYLCAQVSAAYENVKAISLHGREGHIVPFVTHNPLVFALSGGVIKAHHIIKQLRDFGLGDVRVTVGEKLSAHDERIIVGTAASLVAERFDDLACLLVHNSNCVNPYVELRDNDFIRGKVPKVPMTKQAVRSVVLATLAIQPRDILWDIGAGTGAVAIAMARKACEGFVYAVEKKQEALGLLQANKMRHGAANMVIVAGEAPAGLGDLPAPDKVFIGGSGGNLRHVVEKAVEVNPHVQIVVTAISLETLHEAMRVFEEMGCAVEAVCINAAVSDKVGAYHLMKAENPVYIITGTVKE